MYWTNPVHSASRGCSANSASSVRSANSTDPKTVLCRRGPARCCFVWLNQHLDIRVEAKLSWVVAENGVQQRTADACSRSELRGRPVSTSAESCIRAIPSPESWCILATCCAILPALRTYRSTADAAPFHGRSQKQRLEVDAGGTTTDTIYPGPDLHSTVMAIRFTADFSTSSR